MDRQRDEPGGRTRVGSTFGWLLRSGRLPALLVAIGCSVLLYGFLFSPDFTVQRVVVRGVALGDAATVAGVANTLDDSVIAVDADAIAARVAALPTVERVSVQTEWPDRVVILVVERTPALAWEADGRTLLVDARGHVLIERDAGELPRLAVDGAAPEAGDSVPIERVTAALAIANQLVGQTSELRWSDAEGFTATLMNGRTVKLGDAARVPLKLAALSAILQRTDVWTLLDVSEPDRPYYK